MVVASLYKDVPLPFLSDKGILGMMAYDRFNEFENWYKTSLENHQRKLLEEAKGEGLPAVEALLSSWKYWNGVAKAQATARLHRVVIFHAMQSRGSGRAGSD
jgi:hypothetical protein